MLLREALYNRYAPLSKDSWNQTLRKSKLFHQSWDGKSVRTKYDGHFDDQITGNIDEWTKGEELTMQNVVTLKLYTDFDELQWAMKQCFRLEEMDENVQKQSDEIRRYNQRERQELEARIEVFFRWRGALMIVLNKFGTRWRDREHAGALYTGINKKMNISSTAAFSFYGPLSTSADYFVAKGFATDKGMILKIDSRFPRLNYCNVFQASLISDYPEEQEWLIGFMCLVDILICNAHDERS